MVMLSTEHSFLPGSAQHEWLAKDLMNVDRKKTPFVIVGGHRAMYCSNRIDGMCIDCQSVCWDLYSTGLKRKAKCFDIVFRIRSTTCFSFCAKFVLR